MDGSRSERARARALHLLAQIAPLPDDFEVQRLRELSLDYIREAERRERAPVTGEQISESTSALTFLPRPPHEHEVVRVRQAKPKRLRFSIVKTLAGRQGCVRQQMKSASVRWSKQYTSSAVRLSNQRFTMARKYGRSVPLALEDFIDRHAGRDRQLAQRRAS